MLLTTVGRPGGAPGWGLTLQLMNRRIPENFLPLGGVSMDARVLLFTAAAGIGASLFFGLLPALGARRIDVRSALASGSSRSVAQSGGTRTRYALIIGEVALTVVLLTVAGLLIRTLVYLRTLPPGFNPENVVVAKASLDDARYNDRASFLKLLDKSTAAMQNIPGVESAAVGLSCSLRTRTELRRKSGRWPADRRAGYDEPGLCDASLFRSAADTSPRRSPSRR